MLTTTKAKLFKTAIVAVEGTYFPKGTVVRIELIGEVAGEKLFKATRGSYETTYAADELDGFVL